VVAAVAAAMTRVAEARGVGPTPDSVARA